MPVAKPLEGKEAKRAEGASSQARTGLPWRSLCPASSFVISLSGSSFLLSPTL